MLQNTMRFAPFTWTYDGLEADYAESQLDKTRNTWAEVDDFNWLNPLKHSPNWSILPEEERATEWGEAK